MINVSNDDLPGYTGDGIDDAWQVQYYGLNNPHAAPNFVSDGSGLTNSFKYTAGLVPNNPASKFTLGNTPVNDQPGKQSITFSPIVAGRNYIVQFSLDLSAGSWQPLTGFTQSDNGIVRTVTDLSAGPLGTYKYVWDLYYIKQAGDQPTNLRIRH